MTCLNLTCLMLCVKMLHVHMLDSMLNLCGDVFLGLRQFEITIHVNCLYKKMVETEAPASVSTSCPWHYHICKQYHIRLKC